MKELKEAMVELGHFEVASELRDFERRLAANDPLSFGDVNELLLRAERTQESEQA